MIWIVTIPVEVVEELQLYVQMDVLDEQGTIRLTEAVVDRIGGLRVEIRAREHGPPHFHVTYAGESNAFAIRDCTPLEGDGLKSCFRKIRMWHERNKALLIDRWNEYRPTDCPVGVYEE